MRQNRRESKFRGEFINLILRRGFVADETASKTRQILS
ncbi:hypothetical protein CAMRE0001_1363 [Campylobacter rectus RM3267]|uniref:Uncharacterized protein n=1 Tax=Campylobacter rectus RM3267 TaxID=553218 RepID=B9D049_CAMRE|nr:hypothetical protein CAMRE0001_1363 [Campylobacter rectus RM3267]